MQPLPPRDVSAIGTALDAMIAAHAVTRRGAEKPSLHSFNFAKAVAQLQAELAVQGFEIVRVAG